MFQNDWVLLKLAQERRGDLMRQIEVDRLVRQAASSDRQRGHTLYHVLDWVGRQLVHWGEGLQARHALYHRHTLTHTTRG